MAKHEGKRGLRGIPGPPGPPGKAGRTGVTGKTGGRGEKGATGARGTRGTTGSRPGALAASDRMEILTIVQEQIEDIHRELNTQLKRMAQLQVQVDEVRKRINQLAGHEG